MASKQYRVMVFPWLAFGHMIPSLELSIKLAAKGIKVSFISTPRNLRRLPTVPGHLTTNLKLMEMILPSVDGLPDNCEATVDLQVDQIQFLKKASDSLQAEMERVMLEDLPDMVLFDLIHCWIPETCSKFGVPSAFFSPFPASTLAFIGPSEELKVPKWRTRPEDFTVKPEWFPFQSSLAFRPDEAPIIFRNYSRIATTIVGCDFVAVRSCREYEGHYINLLEQLYHKPVLPVGLLPPVLPENKDEHHQSLVFVGFGSEYKMPLEQVHELAHGIELSNLSFIWVLRKPRELDISELLPTEFLARTSDRGIVYLGWAPQTQILAHPVIGGCLFHSGWGSIVESLSLGHPQILMPMISDQGLNAKVLVEKGIGLEVPRSKDGSCYRDAIAKSMRVVMVEKEGQELRRQAAEMRAVFGNQDLHDDYIEEFIRYIVNFKKHSTST
ncbi:hypothetical protein K2173_009113 [Erythroxylum novogranatense]|uniref:Glycosyltransferase n=1 Tax=Erythroxylum novogranatense TaxID=1862640 RepID=A0AAV8TDG9_9ROSI|nr:hypothetical protein K2173_009113 [Erythroxylum novogranatense]